MLIAFSELSGMMLVSDSVSVNKHEHAMNECELRHHGSFSFVVVGAGAPNSTAGKRGKWLTLV